MRSGFFPAIFFGILFSVAVPVAAQDIDTLVTTTNRSPSTVADQISDAGERNAFLNLYKSQEAGAMLQAAKSFLQNYPQSAFLAQAYEVAADGSFDQGDFTAGLEYARQSLTYLPENPQLLVAVADVQARQHLNDEAITNAKAALYYFDRFGRPGAIAESRWPDLKRRMLATANFALGRALLQEAVAGPAGEKRNALLKDSKMALERARSLNAADSQIVYVLGLVQLSSGDFQSAAESFAAVYIQKNELAPKALEHLQTIYETLDPKTRGDFDAFVARATESQSKESDHTAQEKPVGESKDLPAYAGSESCRGCHSGIYKNWSQSGMSKMLRAYAPQNVIGDFTENNQFFASDEPKFEGGKLQIVRAEKSSPFARMELHEANTTSTSSNPMASGILTRSITRLARNGSKLTRRSYPTDRFMCFRSSTARSKSSG